MKGTLLTIALLVIFVFVSWKSSESFSEAAEYAHVMHSRLFGARIHAYILTSSCERRCSHLTEWIPEGTFMLDGSDESEACNGYANWNKQVVESVSDDLESTPPKKYRDPETEEELQMVVKDPDLKFRTPEFQKWMEKVEARYRNKYTQTLRACSKGKHDLCMLLEDDIVFINEPDVNLFRLAVQTFPKYSGPEVSWDCAKIGNGWEARKIDGNKSQCRIVHRRYAGCLADYFETSGEPADIALAKGMAHCEMTQKWFLLVQHVGRQSSMGHEQ